MTKGDFPFLMERNRERKRRESETKRKFVHTSMDIGQTVPFFLSLQFRCFWCMMCLCSYSCYWWNCVQIWCCAVTHSIILLMRYFFYFFFIFLSFCCCCWLTHQLTWFLHPTQLTLIWGKFCYNTIHVEIVLTQCCDVMFDTPSGRMMLCCAMFV